MAKISAKVAAALADVQVHRRVGCAKQICWRLRCKNHWRKLCSGRDRTHLVVLEVPLVRVSIFLFQVVRWRAVLLRPSVLLLRAVALRVQAHGSSEGVVHVEDDQDLPNAASLPLRLDNVREGQRHVDACQRKRNIRISYTK